MANVVPLCADPACPCAEKHVAVPYNLQVRMNDANRTFKLPEKVRQVVTRINLNQSEDLANHDFLDWSFLAKFAVAHQCHRKGLMPAEITKRAAWKHPDVQAILATVKTPEVKAPVNTAQKSVKPATIDYAPKKTVLPTTGRRFAMGRGVDLTKACFTPGKVCITPPGASNQIAPSGTEIDLD